jgi:hypothetical protein
MDGGGQGEQQGNAEQRIHGGDSSQNPAAAQARASAFLRKGLPRRSKLDALLTNGFHAPICRRSC